MSGRRGVPRNWVFSIVLTVVLLSLSLTHPARGSDSTEAQIERQQKELERLQDEIRQNKKRDQRALAKEKSILSVLQEMDDQIRIHEKRLGLMQLKIRQRDAQIDRLGKEIDSIRREIELKRGLITQRVRTLYKEGAGRNLSVLFSSQNSKDFENRVYFIQWDAQRQRVLLNQFNQQAERLEEKNSQLEENRGKLSREKAELVQELDSVREERRRKKILLASIQNERSSYERAISELNESSVQLQLLLEELRERQSKSLPKGKFVRQKGRLVWPNPGEVVALFGRQKHPKFNTYIYKKGIEIRPDNADTVRAIYQGRVIYADWFRGYGMVVILDHGDTYYSLYAHLAKTLVSVGEYVTQNKIIGEVGETGLVQESRLYFEIRHQGEPMDPMGWLEKRHQGGKR
jgi:septal ring factor EnvC (AmiA/AmiB activator)